MARTGYLKGGDVTHGSLDDSFYFSELYLKKVGNKLGKNMGMTPKQSKKKNKLLKTLKELATKGHFTHSPTQRDTRFLHSFQEPILDTKIGKIRKVLKRFPK